MKKTILTGHKVLKKIYFILISIFLPVHNSKVHGGVQNPLGLELWVVMNTIWML